MATISGPAVAGFDGNTSEVSATQNHAFGRRAYDNDGNEYVYVDFQESFIRGEWCAFDSAFAATQLTSTSRGWVGVVDGTVSASDRFGWVMVRGIHTAAWATSGATTADPVVIAATTDLGHVATGTSADTSILVSGAKICTAPDTCASTALSTSALAAPCTVMLNYPFISGVFAVSSYRYGDSREISRRGAAVGAAPSSALRDRRDGAPEKNCVDRVREYGGLGALV